MVSEDGSPTLNDSAPPYLARCEEMKFGELREFVDDALEKLPDGDPDLPLTEPEFVFLADMLDAKLDALEATVPDSLPPAPRVPEPPSYGFSEEISSVSRRRSDLRRDIEWAWSDGFSSREKIANMKGRLRDLERELERLEAAEEERYEERLAAYREALGTYNEAMREWRAITARPRKVRAYVEPRRRFVDRIRLNIQREFRSGVATRSSSFPFLPSGKLPHDQVRGYYRDVQRRNPGVRYDEGRIENMLSLGPSELRQHEASGFDGYTLCRFPYTESVLLECPKVGNAIYVLHGDWKRRAGANKQELRADTSGDVVVIPHQGDDWFAKVQQELGAPPDVGVVQPEAEAS